MSEKFGAKHVILLAIVAVLAFFVLRDRTSASADVEPTDSPRQSYVDASVVTRSAESLIADRDRWAAANDAAKQRWNETLATLILAPSVNVAESTLRAVIEEEMRTTGLTLSVSSPMPRQTPIEGEPLRVIGLTLNFDAPNPDALHALLDRIENAASPRMVTTDLEIRGPGRTGRSGLHIKMDVAAMAWLASPSMTGGVNG